ncbi:MAG: 5'/3'-nucleotidase SurE [Acidimicrobiales bacterium]
MRVLVTNDDGIDAPGLAILARAIADRGFDVLVAAPAKEESGAGAGVGPLHTLSDGINVLRVDRPGLEGIEALAVEALPALIVIAACLGAYGPPPDLIVAGINPGRNVGRAVLHSGTIGAALTSVHFEKRGLAMSIQSGPFSSFESDAGASIHFDTAAQIAVELVPRVAAAPARTVVSCNVPNLPIQQLAGIRWAGLARSGLIRSALVDSEGGSRMQLELGFGDPPPGDESDETLTALGYATITPLASVAEETRPEVRAAVARAVDGVGKALGLSIEHSDEAEGPAA